MNARLLISAWLFFAAAAFAAEVPDDFKTGPVDCDTLKNDPQSRFRRMEAGARRGEPSVEQRIDELRLMFWFTYPDVDAPNRQKPGHDRARDEFAQALFEKDVFYLQANVARRLSEDLTRDESTRRGLAMIGNALVKLSGGIDGGIRQTARPEFDAWVEATRRALGFVRNTAEIFPPNFSTASGFVSETFRQAANPGGKECQAYLMERDWAEFDAAGRVPAGYSNRENFGILLYFRRGLLTYPEAAANYANMQRVLGRTEAEGRKIVEDAAEQVLRYATQNKTGVRNLVVTAKPALKRGPGGSMIDDDDLPMPPGVLGRVGHPLEAMETLATQDDDRRYLLHALTTENRKDSTSLDRPNQWAFAENRYKRLVIAFGEKDVLDAARAVRTATKRMANGRVMDPPAIGATREHPYTAFEDILARKNPRGYLRSALMFNAGLDSAAAADAAYGKLIAGGDERAWLEAARRMAEGQPHLIYPGELPLLREARANPPLPEKPAVNAIDYPEYLAWRGFSAEAKVSRADRIWQLAPTGDRLVPGPLRDRQAYQLQTITSEQVKLWFTQTSFDQAGRPRPARDSEVGYPAKLLNPPEPGRFSVIRAAALVPEQNHWGVITPSTAPIETGEETIEIGGRRFAAEWRSQKFSFEPGSESKDATLIVKVWTSDAVPGGLVRRIEDRIHPPSRAAPRGARFVYETFLESFEGTRAGLAPPDSSRAVAPPYAPAPMLGVPGGTAAPPTPSAPPASAPAAPSQPRPGGAAQGPALSGDMASRIALGNQFRAVTDRISRVRAHLLQYERSPAAQGRPVPASVRAARERLDAGVPALAGAMQRNDAVLFAQAQRAAEENLGVIEDFLPR